MGINQILYGVSGSGKSYKLIIEALKIFKSENIKNEPNYVYSKEEYEILRKEFNNLVACGRIKIIGFHKNYTYSEFIENKEHNDGIFKKFCKEALFDCLAIDDKKLLEFFSFDKIMYYFQEVYPTGSVLEVKNVNFEILRYTTNVITLRQNTKNNIIELQLEPLRQLMQANTSKKIKGSEIKAILSRYHGLTGYYYKIFEEFNALIQLVKDKLVDEYYRNSYELKTDNISPYVLIIEDICNSDVAGVFGEVLSLIDNDKRAISEVVLPYSRQRFIVPPNVFILGTLTTPVDLNSPNVKVLLRKFDFIECKVDYNLVADFGCNFKETLKILNERLLLLFGDNYLIGHGLFAQNKHEDSDIEVLKEIWFKSVIPILRYYTSEDWSKLQKLLGEGVSNGSAFIKKANNDKVTKYFATEQTLYEWAFYDNSFDFYQALEYAFS